MIQMLDAAQLNALMESQDPPRLIDVRTATEVARGTIAGAQHIDLGTLPERLGALDPLAPVVLMCQSGGRSSQGCVLLEQRGFKRVYNLAGGFGGWIRAGLPVTA